MVPFEDYSPGATIESPHGVLEGLDRHNGSHRCFWSCETLYENHKAAFHPSTSYHSDRHLAISETDGCGLCGEEFPNEPAPDWDNRLAHLRSVHTIGVCSRPIKKFFKAYHFRLHLKHRHAAKTGKWSRTLETASMQEEEVQGSPDTSDTSHASQDDGSLTPQMFQSDDHDSVLRELTKEMYPAAVVDYIFTRRQLYLFEGHLALLKVGFGLNQPKQTDESDGRAAYIEPRKHPPHLRALEDTLVQLRDDLKNARRRCLQAGHSLYEIDQVLYQTSHHDSSMAGPIWINHSDMFEIRRNTLTSNLLGQWTTTRDRINGWLLHSLRSDDSLARVHRSMLVEENLDEKVWAKLVVEYWALDEAATGSGLAVASSAEATCSHMGSYHECDDFYTCRGSQSDC